MKEDDRKEYYMKQALKEAQKAKDKLEVPIGAVIVKEGKIIARAHNLRESKKSAIAHAEVLAIQKACKKLDSWRLIDCDMYVTLEPCSMCAGAILNSRLHKVYIGAPEQKSGAVGSQGNLLENASLAPKVEYEIGVLEEECRKIVQSFFQEMRIRDKEEKNKRKQEP